MIRHFLFAFFFMCAGAVMEESLAATPVQPKVQRAILLNAISFLSDDHAAYVTLELSNRATFHTQTLTAPDRLVVDIENTRWNVSAPPVLPNWITAIRHAHREEGILRIVLDSNAPLRVLESSIPAAASEQGFRIRIQVAAPTNAETETIEAIASPKIQSANTPHAMEDNPFAEQSAEAIEPAAPEKTEEKARAKNGQAEADTAEKSEEPDEAEEPSVTEQNPWVPVRVQGVPKPILRPTPEAMVRKPLIVIDAGHGGHDPGAQGAKGTFEKNLTLSYALHLRDALIATKRYRVLLTREEDRFIPLNERVAIAQKHKGDIFVSLHADSHNNPYTRGLSVYTLSEKASDKEAEALARKENIADALPGLSITTQQEDIAEVLIGLAQRHTKNDSSQLAESLVQSLHTSIHVLQKPHRFAGFRVLMAPDIPSILVELGYLSNPREESLLLSEEYKKRLVSSIVQAIDAFFKK